MTKFYTFVESNNSNIFHRYIEDGVSKIECLKDYEFELFIKTNKDPDAISIYNEPLKRYQSNSLKDFNDLRSTFTDQNIPIYGMQSPQFQFISSEYKGEINFKFEQIKILVLDIETRIPEDGTFCQASDASQPIVSIATKLFGNHDVIVFSYNYDYKCKENEQYIKCDSEIDMLERFISYIQKTKPDIVTGYNIDLYDIPFIINRITILLGKNQCNLLSPLSNYLKTPIKENNTDRGVIYKIQGISNIDYLDVYKHFSISKQENYRLDTIAEIELSENKLDYGEYKNLNELYDNDFQRFIEYNIVDILLVERLDKKLNFFNTIFTVAYDGKINYYDVMAQTRFWDCKIYNTLRDRGIQIPPNENYNHLKISGGHVKDPQVGLHSWVCSFDLNSLYPSIIRMLNMSPETIVNSLSDDLIQDFINQKELNTNSYKSRNLGLAANSSTYRKDIVGIIPELLKISGDDRVRFKNQMLEAKKNLEPLKLKLKESYSKELEAEIKDMSDLIIRLDSLQNAKKIANNSIYGAVACQYFRYYNPSIASGITMTGQSIIQYIERKVNEFLNSKFKTENEDYIILSDTDSIAIRLEKLIDIAVPEDKRDVETVTNFIVNYGNKVLNPYISKCFLEFEEYINAYESRLVMKMENICDKAFLRAKKNYVMGVRWSEGVKYPYQKLKLMGIEIARSSTPKFIKNALTDVIKIILNGTEQELQDYIKEFKSIYYNTPVEDIALPRGITDMDKWVESEFGWKTGTPIHVKAALCYNHLIKVKGIASDNPPLLNGSKCKFIYIKQPNEIFNNAIAFIDKLPKEFGLDDLIDCDIMYEKSFLNPVKSFSDILTWQTEKVFTLDSFF